MLLRFNRLAWSVAAMAVILAGCHKKDDKPTPQPPVKVTVMKVGESSENAPALYSGTVAASESTTVSFSVPGTILELYAAEGKRVSKGQLLGKLKDADYINSLNIAQAQLAEAQDGYTRLKKLHDANALPDVKWVEMEQKLKQAQNAAEMAQNTLNDTRMHAPMTGTVTAKYADAGQTVLPAQPVFEIVSTDQLEMVISVSESEISNFDIGDKASIVIDNAEGLSVTGEVTQKAVVADPLTRTYKVKISLPTKSSKILPGMIGSVKFQGKTVGQAPQSGYYLPPQAVLLNNDNRWFVWLANDSVAQRRFVTADHLSSSGVIVTSGLNPGDMVITDGTQKVSAGTKLRYEL